VRLRTAMSLVFTASMTAAACSDSVTLQPAPVVAPTGPRLYAGVDSSGEVWPARIRSATATLDPISPTGYTVLKAEMYFDGTEASISGSSMIRESSGQIVQRAHPVWDAEEGGINARHWAHYNLIVQSVRRDRRIRRYFPRHLRDHQSRGVDLPLRLAHNGSESQHPPGGLFPMSSRRDEHRKRGRWWQRRLHGGEG
jgi:hypothetical protein